MLFLVSGNLIIAGASTVAQLLAWRASRRVFWLLGVVANACYAGSFGIMTGTSHNALLRGFLGLFTLWFVFGAYVSFRQWLTHKDDDDDFGNKLKGWAKNNLLPRPKVHVARAGL